MSHEGIECRTIGRVCHVTLDRPARLNALATPHVRELQRIVLRAWRDDNVGALLLSGTGKAFCTGFDLTGSDLGTAGATAWNDLFNLLAEIPKPTVAAVNGVAAGGGLHLALACDLALCVDDARLIESFVRIGASPDTGGHLYLQRSLGHTRAAELMLRGVERSGRELTGAGLFVSSWPTVEALHEAALNLATELASGPRLAYQVIRKGLEHARLHGARALLAWEAEQEERMASTADMRDGVAAFREKRKPLFRGE